jgi:hypothetical protein
MTDQSVNFMALFESGCENGLWEFIDENGGGPPGCGYERSTRRRARSLARDVAESFWTPTKTDELQNEPNLIDRGARAHRTTSGRVHRRERQRVVAWIKKVKGAVGEIHSTADEIFSNAKKHENTRTAS